MRRFFPFDKLRVGMTSEEEEQNDKRKRKQRDKTAASAKIIETTVRANNTGTTARARITAPVTLEEGGDVFAEFGEGVEGAAPEDTALLERDEHGAEEREGEDQSA